MLFLCSSLYPSLAHTEQDYRYERDWRAQDGETMVPPLFHFFIEMGLSIQHLISPLLEC